MKRIQHYETAQHAWYDLVKSHSQLPESIESYLTFALARHVRHDYGGHVLALEWLDMQAMPGQYQLEHLRDFADTCLILSGLFPDYVRCRHVSVNYCQSFGRMAFSRLASLYASQSREGQAELYALLEQEFLSMVKVMQAIRDIG